MAGDSPSMAGDLPYMGARADLMGLRTDLMEFSTSGGPSALFAAHSDRPDSYPPPGCTGMHIIQIAAHLHHGPQTSAEHRFVHKLRLFRKGRGLGGLALHS